MPTHKAVLRKSYVTRLTDEASAPQDKNYDEQSHWGVQKARHCNPEFAQQESISYPQQAVNESQPLRRERQPTQSLVILTLLPRLNGLRQKADETSRCCEEPEYTSEKAQVHVMNTASQVRRSVSAGSTCYCSRHPRQSSDD